MTTIDCREAVRRMWTYLARSLEHGDADELEGHLAVCQRCCGELEFHRELRERISGAAPDEMPPDVRSKVDELLHGSTLEHRGGG